MNVSKMDYTYCTLDEETTDIEKSKGLWIRLYYSSGDIVDGVIPNSLLLDLSHNIRVIIGGQVKTVKVKKLARIEVVGVLKK